MLVPCQKIAITAPLGSSVLGSYFEPDLPYGFLVSALEDTGGVPFDILEPMLSK